MPQAAYFNAYAWSARVPLDPLFAKAISLIQASSRPTASAADQGPAPQFIMQMLDSGKSMRTTTGRLPNRESARCIPLLLPIHLSPELQAKLDRVAADNHCRQGEYVQQLVESYLDHDAWFRQKATASLGKLDNGEYLTHEEVGARLKKMFQP